MAADLEFNIQGTEPCHGPAAYFARTFYSTGRFTADRSPQIYLGSSDPGYEAVYEDFVRRHKNIRRLAAMAIMRQCPNSHKGTGPRVERVQNVVFTRPNEPRTPIRPPHPEVRFAEGLGRVRRLDFPDAPPLDPTIFLPASMEDRIAHPALVVVEATPNRFDHIVHVALRGLERVVEVVDDTQFDSQ